MLTQPFKIEDFLCGYERIIEFRVNRKGHPYEAATHELFGFTQLQVAQKVAGRRYAVTV